jgi:hypothetical protein
MDQFSANPSVPPNSSVPGEGSGQVANTSSSQFLPQYYNTDLNKKFLTNTLDQLTSKGTQEEINLYVGKKSGTVYKADSDFYLKETRQDRSDYQLEVGIVTKDADGNITSTLTYDDIIEELKSNWSYTKPDQFDSEYYSFTPPIDYDKFINFTSYHWMKTGLPGMMIEGNINIENDIIGKPSYTTPVQRNGQTINLQNGMKVYFVNSETDPQGVVSPSWFVSEKTPVLTTEFGVPLMTMDNVELMSTNPDAEPTYFIVEGVGDSIFLVPADQFDQRIPYSLLAQVEWDAVPWDSKKYDTAIPAPGEKEYVVMQRGCADRNAWSRINQWYRVETIKDVYNYIGLNPADYLKLEYRGNRPIIEFHRDMELYDSGITQLDVSADLVAYNTKITDFLNKTSVTIDGISVVPGSKVLFIDSPDSIINNKLINLYTIPDVNGGPDIYRWQEVTEFGTPTVGQKIFVNSGVYYRYKELTFNGTKWYLGQNKITVNQAPKFVLYDHKGNQLNSYRDNDFTGNTILEYKTGTFYDKELKINVTIEDTNYDIVSNSSPFAKTFTNLFFNNTLADSTYYKNSKGLRDVIPGNYYWKYYDRRAEASAWSNGWVKNAEPAKTYQRISKLVTDPTSQNSVMIPGDSWPSYTYSATIIDNKIRFYCLSKNNEWVPFDWSSNTLAFGVGFEFRIILNTNGQSMTISDIDGNPMYGNGVTVQEPTLIVGNPLAGGVWKYECNGITGFIKVVNPNTDTRSFKVRINGTDTTEWTTVNTGGNIQVNITATLAVNDLIEVLFESASSAGTYSVHSTLEANPNNENIGSFTYSEIFAHFKSKVVNQYGFEGAAYGSNNYYQIIKDGGTGWVAQQQLNPAVKLGVLLRENETLPNNVLQYGAEQNKLFRQKFINKLTSLEATLDVQSMTVRDLVRESLIAINVGKGKDFPFAFSDMLYYVDTDATSTRTYIAPQTHYLLGTTIDPASPYRDHVYVYVNDIQLLVDQDYTLQTDRVLITAPINDGDSVRLLVLTNLGNCYVPASTAKLGLTSVYTPELYYDSTNDTDFIICHDGSQIVAFGDYKDAVILEFEKSIYNNIYSKFRHARNKWLNIEPGQNRPTQYNPEQRLSYVGDKYRLWRLQNSVSDNSNAQFYQEENPFTWNYNGVSWRSIYRYLFDTDRPHTHPWEMLGYTIKPSWWDTYYSWTDVGQRAALINAIRSGNIAEPPHISIDVNLVRPDIDIPVDSFGNLLDPVSAYIVPAPSAEQAQADWAFGALGNQEMAWVRSSEYPWALSQWFYSAKPNQWVESCWEPESNAVDSYGTQEIYDSLGRRPHLSDLLFHREYRNGSFNVRLGFQHILAENLIQDSKDLATNFYNKIRYAGSQLQLKLGGFADKTNLSFLADTLKVQQGSNFIPEEDYQVVLHKGSTYREFFYSGVKVVYNGTGYAVHGYDLINPYFTVYQPKNSTRYKDILYNGIKVKEATDWEVTPVIIDYGYTFMSRQAVWNFFVGYNKYLIDQGMIFDEYDSTLGAIRDFNLSARQFLFWSESKWTAGYSISLSPCANQIIIDSATGWVEDLNVTVRGYTNILDKDQNVIPVSSITFNRLESGRNIINTRNAYDGIYGLRLRFSELEHLVVFDNRTIFNDIIYDPQYRLKQYRFKVLGTRTPNWNGRPKTAGYMVYGDTIISNFDRTVSDISDRYFSVEGSTQNKSLVNTARHGIGIQQADYLKNILLDPSVSFEFQRGMLHQKGTPAAYDKLLRTKSIDSNLLSNTNLKVSEEWLFKLGDFGAIDTWQSYELKLRQRDILDDQKQLFRMIPLYNSATKTTNRDLATDLVVDLTPADTRWVSKPGDDNLVFPTRPLDQITDTITEVIYEDLPSAGFVRLDQVDYTVDNPADLYTIFNKLTDFTDILNWTATTSYKIGDTVRNAGYVYTAAVNHVSGETFQLANWTISKEPSIVSILVGNYVYTNWQVLRSQDKQLAITAIESYDETYSIDGVTSPTLPSTVTFAYPHNLQVGDDVMLVNTDSKPTADGFTKVYKVINNTTIVIETPTTTAGTQGKVIPFMPVRFATEAAMTASLTDPRYVWNDITTDSTATEISQLAFVDYSASAHGYKVFQWNEGSNPIGNTFVPYERFDTVDVEQEMVDSKKIHSISIYDRTKNRVIVDLELWDPYKGFIPKAADVEIDIKSPIDEAKYTDSTNPFRQLDHLAPWGAEQLGSVWWDLSTVKYVNYESGSLDYRQQNWGKLFTGSTVDVYEWVQSSVDPIAYNDAVTNSKEVDGKVPTGTAKFVNKNGQNWASWSTEVYVDDLNVTHTRYYFWVKNLDTVPNTRPERKLPVAAVSNIIADPASIGLSWFAPISTDAFIVSNVKALLNNENTTLQIQIKNDDTPAHSQWMLLREYDNNTGIPDWLHQRLKDSLSGYSSNTSNTTWVEYTYGTIYHAGDVVKVGEDYYRVFRTFQPYEASVVTAINKKPMYKLADYELLPNNVIKLSQHIEVPDSRLNEFDRYGNRIRPTQQTWIKDRANARKNLVEALNTLLLEIDLVHEIPYWNKVLGTSFIRGSITYDLTKFWSYYDYTNTNYEPTKTILYSVDNEGQLDAIVNLLVDGDYVGVGTPVNGQYPLVYERYNDQFTVLYRQNGTIQFDETLFDSYIQLDIWDLGGWDFKAWDSEPSQELEKILQTFRDDIFVDTYQSYYNRLFFAMVKFIYTEQNNVDWIAKSTYLHIDNLEIAGLSQLPYYKEDQIEHFISYINEVKPYRTKLREVFDTRRVADEISSTGEDSHSTEIHIKFNRTGRVNNDSGAGSAGDFLVPVPGFANQVWGAVINDYEIPWDATLPAMDPINRYMFMGSEFGVPASEIDAILDGHRNYGQALTDDGWGEEIAPITAGDVLEIDVQTNYPGEVYSFRIFKNIVHQFEFSRIANSAKTTLVAPLAIDDTEIEVANGSVFGGVDFIRQQPGVIFINGERIEFYRRSGNTLHDVVRGTGGTSVLAHPFGSKVIDALPREEIPMITGTPGNIGFNDPGQTLRDSTNPLAVFITAKQGDLL